MKGKQSLSVSDPQPRLVGTPGRAQYLDGLRALAALQVVLHHCFLTVYPLSLNVAPTGLTKLATSSMMLAGLGVTVFVALSGYVLSIPAHRDGWVLRNGAASFLRRRTRRLVPVYLVTLLLSVPLGLTLLSERSGSLWDSSVPFDVVDVVAHLLLVHDVVGNPYAINHPLWSIAVIFHLYLLFPLLVAGARRWGIARVGSWAVTISTLVGVVAFQDFGASVLLRQFQFVGIFAAGMVTFSIVQNDGAVSFRGRWRQPRWVLIAAGLIVLWAAAPLNHFNHVPFGLAVCCLMIEMGTGGLGRLRSALQWRGLVWGGALSLSLYLVHAPVVHIVWLEFLRPAGYGVGDLQTLVLLIPLAVPASLLVAWMFYRTVERRLRP